MSYRSRISWVLSLAKLKGNYFFRFPLVSESKCREYSRMIQKSSSFYEADDKIVNGTDAKLGEFPHFAELGYGDYPYTWKCGASLISENFVLTAAHCTSEHNPVTAVQFGDVVLDSHQSKTYGVFRTYVHPEYSPGISYHDIALLELEETVEFTPYIKPACLPRSTNELQQKLVATGFGLLDFTDFANSYKLQKVTLDFFPFNRCNQKFGGGNKFPEGIQEKFQICYGGRRDRKDTCLGDSGGPLQYYEYEISLFRVIGIVSQGGRRCGRPGFPGIYTRVSHYLAWIVPIVWG